MRQEPTPTPPIKMRWFNRDWVPLMRGGSNGNGDTPLGRLVGLGLSTFLVLYLLGALTSVGMPSPILDWARSAQAAIEKHEQKTDVAMAAQLRALRALCRHTVPVQSQHECD